MLLLQLRPYDSVALFVSWGTSKDWWEIHDFQIPVIPVELPVVEEDGFYLFPRSLFRVAASNWACIELKVGPWEFQSVPAPCVSIFIQSCLLSEME